MLCINYRPISLVSIYSKIFEKLIYSRMYYFLNKNNLIYGKQFGFRAKHSVNHALISTTELVKDKLECGNFLAGIFIDLEKAFDTVNHEILIDKLAYYGFRGVAQNLIKSFLTNRKQYVSVNGFDSDNLDVVCGVPQGSTLGPLLFLIDINDLRFSLKSSVANHFADDTCITHQSKKLKTLETELNHDLKLCTEWLNANRLSLNIDKTKLLLFHSKKKCFDYNDITIKLNKFKLNPSDNVKYLGIFLDKNLSWDYQIIQLSKKLSRANGVFFKLRKYIPKETLTSVYYSIFYSHMTYACQVWSLTTKHNLDIINILQKKCLRIINFAAFNSHTNGLFYRDKILKFEDVIKLEQMKIIFEFKTKCLPSDLSHLFHENKDINCHATRNVSKGGFFIPQIRTKTFGKKSLKYSAPVLWNEHLKTEDRLNTFTKIGPFKKYIKNFYISSYNEI